MKAKIGFILGVGVGMTLMTHSALAGAEYQGKLEAGLSRGFRNIIGAPLEIPVTIRKYHTGGGRPVIRETAGLMDGTFRMVSREVNGLMDTVLVLVPGEQEGIPMSPETLF